MKNKALIVTNIILLSLVIIILVFLMVWGMFGKFPNFLSSTKLIYEKTYTLEEINEVKMNFKNYDIEIVEGIANDIKLEIYSNKDKQNIDTDLKQNILKLKQNGSTFCFGFCYYNQKVVLTVPKENTLLFNLISTSGDITSNVPFNQIGNIVHSTSGDIEIDDILNGEVKTTSGDISVGESDSLNLYSTSGEISAERINKGKVATTSGDIYLGYFEQGEVSSTSGEIVINKYKGNGEVSTTSGDIEINAFEIFDKTRINSTSGDVDINLKNEALISTSTKSGEVKVKPSRGEHELIIKTISGDITVK